MPAIDDCEEEILEAFQKDEWELEEKPFKIRSQRLVFADFSLRHKDELIIVVEVKCFTRPDDDLTTFYKALGQYEYYLAAMKEIGLTVPLYLVLPELAYQRLLLDPAIRRILNYSDIKYVLVNLPERVITQWKS